MIRNDCKFLLDSIFAQRISYITFSNKQCFFLCNGLKLVRINRLQSAFYNYLSIEVMMIGEGIKQPRFLCFVGVETREGKRQLNSPENHENRIVCCVVHISGESVTLLPFSLFTLHYITLCLN